MDADAAGWSKAIGLSDGVDTGGGAIVGGAICAGSVGGVSIKIWFGDTTGLGIDAGAELASMILTKAGVELRLGAGAGVVAVAAGRGGFGFVSTADSGAAVEAVAAIVSEICAGFGNDVGAALGFGIDEATSVGAETQVDAMEGDGVAASEVSIIGAVAETTG